MTELEEIRARKFTTCGVDIPCNKPVTHIDVKGWIYCKEHGEARGEYVTCRELTFAELELFKAGMPIRAY